ncbi:low molecular weight phosphotyrosine protein phosphatase [Pseudomonas paracarnis]|uniref:arsenate reductase/protein-tyrosine-phosphatase family protein n=1 Tax=Pseudomonas paracarnis TaxID=2750625 RepID=UPI002FE2899C
MFWQYLPRCHLGAFCIAHSVDAILRSALPVGRWSISPRAVLEDHGHPADEYQAIQLAPRELSGADLILVMIRQYVSAVFSMDLEVRGEILLLVKWQNEREIGDPYRQRKLLLCTLVC